MTAPRAAWAALIFLSALPAAHGCRGIGGGLAHDDPRTDRATSAPATGPVLQIMHRSARSRSGELYPSAIATAADLAMVELSGHELPFEAWASLADASGAPPVIVDLPGGSALARAVRERLAIALGLEVELVGDWPLPAAKESWRRCLVVIAPVWSADGTEPRLEAIAEALETRGYPQPDLVLSDLFTPRIGAESWAADTLVAASGWKPVALVSRYILEARARGRVPDAGALAAALQISLDELEWKRKALAR
ncbi:MAG: hypothetical protein JSV80_04785 [Acidobacteriota bacterium]|nr:MAG: hypothetical protein JSV80_04785 [Acidobacteriota bacterium]